MVVWCTQNVCRDCIKTLYSWGVQLVRGRSGVFMEEIIMLHGVLGVYQRNKWLVVCHNRKCVESNEVAIKFLAHPSGG